MTGRPPAGEVGPARITTLAIDLAVRVLPRGATRDRYRREFLADLDQLDRRHRRRYAVGVATHVVPLRIALDHTSRTAWEAVVGPRIRKPLLCRLNLRHRWVTRSSEDGSTRYRACSRCGKEFDVRFAPIYIDRQGL